MVLELSRYQIILIYSINLFDLTMFSLKYRQHCMEPVEKLDNILDPFV